LLQTPFGPAGWCFFAPASQPVMWFQIFSAESGGGSMQRFLFVVDGISSWVGQVFSWLVLALTLLISWEVFSRYVLNSPNPWSFDLMIMMYGTIIMMAGAYTLAKNGHVRGDVLYGFFPPRLQAGLDLLLYFLFFIPGIIALVLCGGVLGYCRALDADSQRSTTLLLQDNDSDRRRAAAASRGR
jgi:TRAP-type C4-dicarboxylate transport system permease small subunit